MKKLILIAIAFISINAMAQEKGSHQKGKQLFKDMSAEDIATLRTKQLTLDLNLNEVQQDEIYELELENSKARKAKREARKTSEKQSEQKERTSEERFAAINAKLDAQIAHKNKMRSILDTSQFEKWERSAKMKRSKRKQKMHRSRRSK